MNIIKSAIAAGPTATIKPICWGPFCGKDPSQAPALLGNLFASIVSILLTVATFWTLIQLITAGLLWISAGGDKARVENAQQRIWNAMLGLIVVAASWAVYLLIINYLGIASQSNGSLIFNIPKIF